MTQPAENSTPAVLRKTIVLVGLMGAGKSTVGQRLANHLGVSFVDSDREIELAANLNIPEIFERFGEQYFREGETRVIGRLLSEKPCILATGGGAFMADENRALIKGNGVSVWIKADLETLWGRVKGKSGRPLLAGGNGKDILSDLLDERYPTYETSDIIVQSHANSEHERVVNAIVSELNKHGYLYDPAQEKR